MCYNPAMKEYSTPIYIYGRHAVTSALAHKPESVLAVFIDPTKKDEKAWKDLLSSVQSARVDKNFKKIEVHDFNPKDLPKDAISQLPDFGSHQGYLAKIDVDRLMVDGKEFIKNFKTAPGSCLVVLGEITDVQNVGSIIRSASGLGVDAVLIPEHNQAQITASVIKISAGQAFTVPLVSIGNTNQALESLKKIGFWIYGMDTEGKNIYEETFSEPSVFVVGSEDAGLRQKTSEMCDINISIPLDPRCESLNAAVSTAIVISEFRRQNPQTSQAIA